MGSERGEETTGREGWQHSPVGSGVGSRAAKVSFGKEEGQVNLITLCVVT